MLRDRVDLWVVFDMAEHGMPDRRLAELARHGNVLRVIEILFPEEDDLPLQERIPDRLQLFLRQRLAEIDASDLRTDVKGQRYDLDGLRCHVPCSSIV